MAKLGKIITRASVVLMAACVAPILLYALLGPADGNPIGLGLLMVFGTPVFLATMTIGLALQLVPSPEEERGVGDE